MSSSGSMDMDLPAVTQEEVLVCLRDEFYRVVPLKYQTYCVLTARICQRALRHFNLEYEVVPCQLWWSGIDGNFVVGFHEQHPQEQWGGHVVCMGQDWLVDAALHHIQKGTGEPVPNILVTRTFAIRSNAISRRILSPQASLWWHRPPAGVQIDLPQEPEDLIARYADELIAVMQQGLDKGRDDTATAVTCDRS